MHRNSFIPGEGKPGRCKRPGFFIPNPACLLRQAGGVKYRQRQIEKEVEMKFLMIVLFIRFVIGLVSNKENKIRERKPIVMNDKVYHPAEFDLR